MVRNMPMSQTTYKKRDGIKEYEFEAVLDGDRHQIYLDVAFHIPPRMRVTVADMIDYDNRERIRNSHKVVKKEKTP